MFEAGGGQSLAFMFKGRCLRYDIHCRVVDRELIGVFQTPINWTVAGYSA
jgi:hypothetical protein